MRPSAGRARSRLTGSPDLRFTKLDRRSVSGARPKRAELSSNSIAVRHTPFTAMLQPSVAPTTASFASTSSSHPSPTVPSHISMRSTFSSRRTVPISSTMPENIAFACGARLSSTAAETTAALLLWLRLRLPAVVQAACEKLLPASVVVDSKRSAVSLFIGCQKTVQIARSHAASKLRGAVGT